MYLIKKIFRGITPPVVLNLARKVLTKKTVKVKKEKRRTQEVEKVGPKTLSLSIGEPLFSVPVEKLRYHGGLHYNYEQHHFLKYYSQGKNALIDFYESHQPKNIFEHHYMQVPENYHKNYKPRKIENDESKKPWLFNVNNIETQGEKGLKSEHGNQEYGPVTEEKIELEAARLDRTLNSIKKDGFEPLQYDGYPRGYFLMDSNDNWSFLVRTGFHRVAALIHLGYTRIPFEFQPRHPRIVYESTCGEWASVKEGYLSKEDAASIFRKYVT